MPSHTVLGAAFSNYSQINLSNDSNGILLGYYSCTLPVSMSYREINTTGFHDGILSCFVDLCLSCFVSKIPFSSWPPHAIVC